MINRKAFTAGLIQLLKKINKWPRWLLVTILLVLIAGGLAAWSVSHGHDQALAVQVGKSAKQNLERVVFTNGTLEAENQQTFFAPEESTLMELNVKLGDRVKKGQVVGRLDTMELSRLHQQALSDLAGKQADLARALASSDQQQCNEAEAAYIKAKNHRERMKALVEAGGICQEEMESAEADMQKCLTTYQEALIKNEQGASQKQINALQNQVNLAGQEVAQARERLDMGTLTAAFEGVVISVDAKEGNRVQEGDQILVLADDQALKVTARVNEVDAGELEEGQAVAISCLALPGENFEGVVSFIGKAAVQEKGQNGTSSMKIPVTAQLKGDTSRLRLGYSVNLSIITMKAQGALTVPVETVLEDDGMKTVWVLKEGRLTRRTVKTIRGNELKDIVKSGLREGEEVVKNPSPDWTDGQKAVATAEEIEK